MLVPAEIQWSVPPPEGAIKPSGPCAWRASNWDREFQLGPHLTSIRTVDKLGPISIRPVPRLCRQGARTIVVPRGVRNGAS
jgi:hypothetical protein